MEYEEVIKYTGDFGKYQKRLLVIVFFPVLFNAFSSPISNFLVGDHKHRCKIPKLPNDTYAVQNDIHLQLINESVPLEEDGSYKQCYILVNGSEKACDEWVFDKSVFTNTILSQFNLVCEYRLSNSHAVATYFFGQMATQLIMTTVADLIGRRLAVCINLTFVFIVNIAMPFSTSVYMFAALRFFDGFFGSALYASTFVISIELLSASKRIIAGTVILLVYCGGEFILVVLAYFIRDWRWLQLTVAIPMVIPLIYWWPRILPESVRWLISRGRMNEALVILKRVAKTNGKSLPDDIKLARENKKMSNMTVVRELLKSRKLLLYWIVSSANWFVVAFIYYGIKLNVGKLGGNIYVSFTLVVIAETLGYAIMFLMDIVGHKRLHMIIMGSTCVCCVASIFPILFAEQSLGWLTVMFALLGKLFVSAAFGMVYVFTGEIFPTVVRTLAIGSCSFFARIGALCAPYLYQLTEGKLKKVLPLILYAVIITVVTLLTIILPETKKRKLPDNVKESENVAANHGHHHAIPTHDKVEDDCNSAL